MKIQQFLMLMLAVTSTAAFFDYRTDCIPECQRQNLSCVISELSPQHFPCDCMDTADACLSRATPAVVCLTPSGEPRGGSEIWQAYWNYTHQPPPRPSPSPNNNTTDFLNVYAAVVTTVLLMICGSSMLRCMVQTWRRRQYQQLNSNSAPSPGVPPPMSEPPYLPTTQAI